MGLHLAFLTLQLIEARLCRAVGLSWEDFSADPAFLMEGLDEDSALAGDPVERGIQSLWSLVRDELRTFR